MASRTDTVWVRLWVDWLITTWTAAMAAATAAGGSWPPIFWGSMVMTTTSAPADRAL